MTKHDGKFDCVFLVRVWDEAGSAKEAQFMGDSRWRGRIEVFNSGEQEYFTGLSELFRLIRSAISGTRDNSDR